ncbi:hypothetical protein [Pseudoroseicyclus tamaricis]|uniref:Uncharacterized protein n=1 Tax=Pseudoroseicyclus tamaricis TaxID=2705421 RepID=A0A6B2JW40_9RHOB|nr:hypothetical protein [Pseudoroseicyclus tamaricis]NDV02498.1 hypothetical protein [Pseudoroseicyclus tamaricis]
MLNAAMIFGALLGLVAAAIGLVVYDVPVAVALAAYLLPGSAIMGLLVWRALPPRQQAPAMAPPRAARATTQRLRESP